MLIRYFYIESKKKGSGKLSIVLIFVFGLFLGSMSQWFAYKVPKEENESMKKSLKEFCKYAKKVANKRTIISILIGAVYCIFYFRYKLSIDFFRYSSVCTVLFVVALIDYKTKDVYFSTICIAAFLSIVFIIIGYIDGISIKSYIFAGISAGIFSTILAALNIIGWGDVEIFIVCGLLVGIYKVTIVIFISIILCGLFGIYTLARNRDKKKLRIAFGPYIIFALMFVIIFFK